MTSLVTWPARTGALFVAGLLIIILAPGGALGQASTGGVTFQNCEKLTATKNIYWNLDKTAGVVTYGLEDQIPDQSWSAFGYNKAGQTRMIPADVVIATAKSAVDYDLSDRAQCQGTDGVCPDTKVGGVNNVKLISAVRVNGISKVVFSKPLKTGDADDLDLTASVNEPVQAIHAAGPLDSSGNPQYHDTSVTGYSNDFYRITLGRTPALNCVPLLPDSAVAPGGAVQAPGPAPALSTAVVASSLPTLPAGTPGCSLTFGGRQLSFQVCRTEAAGITYRWNNIGVGQLEVALSCDHDGWCGFGIGPKMVGSSAIVGFPGGSTGTYINNYLLGGEDTDAVDPGSGTLRVGQLESEYVDGVLTMLFNLTPSSSQYPSSQIIVAKGSSGNAGNGRIPEHDTYFQGHINWALGTVQLELNRGLTRAHGILMMVVWVFFFPAGVLSARYLKHCDPLWWHLHRGFQALGFILFCIAMGLSLKAKAIDGQYSSAHVGLGVAIFVMVILQILAVVLRPKKASKLRFGWNLYHHNLGRLALLLSIPQIYLGLHLFSGGSAYYVVYSVLWVFVLFVYFVVEMWWRCMGPWSRRYSDANTLPQARPVTHDLPYGSTDNLTAPVGSKPYALSVENVYAT